MDQVPEGSPVALGLVRFDACRSKRGSQWRRLHAVQWARLQSRALGRLALAQQPLAQVGQVGQERAAAEAEVENQIQPCVHEAV